ncbi:hypothetical protein HELRODRAFT_191021 [Helobdella robusta]|uniref:Uncharacterized protein n=1 Tax=Helobdella robusta TaxID=6412 RepID=T1FSI3_HELRO|nr:hypothetical protein HELRODRAFT_191021 [Helobdella robusta]ESO07724.1 hypothetical protein HELRODRAFT_191021 [Helobdella robusta]
MYLPGWLEEVRNHYDSPSNTNNKTPGAFSSTNYNNNHHEDEDEAVDSSLNYGVVIDCGSSGSRLFVYYWQQHTGEPNQLLDIKILKDTNNKTVVSKIEPGLSSYSKTPSQASDYIAPLLKFAQDHIPVEKIKETPLYILATAGMRLLPKEEQTALLNDLRTDIGLDFDFLFSPAHIEVISGKWEGIYGWTAVNHVFGKFNHKLSDDSLVAVDVGNKVHIRKRTVGMLDLGGASLQMTFEIPQTHSYIDSKIKEHVVEFNLGCTSSDSSHIYKIYSRTFLGYGSNEGRQRYSQWLVNHFKNNVSVNFVSTCCCIFIR